MTQVAILWHMHQPFYEDLATGEHILPWVRLHALKDYYGMVALLREFPGVKVTFNLVPSLLVQLEAFAAGRAHDRCLELSLKPATELTETDVDFILENFFHAQRERMIDAHPRYRELLARRGEPVGAGGAMADRRVVARRFSADELRDLQVWHKLVWIDPDCQRRDARVRDLMTKGQHFSEEDKSLLRAVELELLNKVIPEYREAAARGQVELSTSPFYHPILPLLCDTDVYLQSHPGSRLPHRRFAYPEDAALQLSRAVACHERLFGRRPDGLWPSEGSVSDAMVPLVATAGFRWMATDELILSRRLGVTFSRDARGNVEQPERLYAPYRVQAGGASVACMFRDHVLSDLIGFTYARWSAEDAADDFVGRLAEAGRRYSERSGGEEALIPIILDGENAWEHFDGGGRPFLRALYRRLSSHAHLRTVTMAEASARPRHTIEGIFPGSWIDADFYIWIGHPDDQRAWGQMAEARRILDEAIDSPGRDRALEELLIAEGSDWCWWYGDDHSSAQDREFDELFRRHLRHAYRLLDKPVPDELFVSNISTRNTTVTDTAPTSVLTPTIDGEETSYFEWLGAGMHEVQRVAATMHQADGHASVLRSIRFGVGRGHLCMRLDGTRRLLDLLGEGYAFTVTFLEPAGIQISARQTFGRLVGLLLRRESNERRTPTSVGEIQIAAGTLLEIAVELAALGVHPGGRLAFFVGVSRDGEVEVERHPVDRLVEVGVPGPGTYAGLWTT